VAIRDGRPRIGRISTGFRPAQGIDEEFGGLLQVQNGKAEVVDSLGYRHTVSVAPNAAHQRRAAHVSREPIYPYRVRCMRLLCASDALSTAKANWHAVDAGWRRLPRRLARKRSRQRTGS